MDEIDIVKFPFYQWTLPNELLDGCDNYITKLNYNLNVDCYSSEVFDYEPLTEYVTSSLTDLQNKIYPNHDNFKIVPTIFWANKTEFLGKHHKHTHANSIYSGIIYLTDNEDSGATRFYYPNPYRYFEVGLMGLFNLSPFNQQTNPKSFFDFYPKRGKMIIFPSNVEHETITNRKKSKRYSISFNTFIKGKIGLNENKTYLTL
jgi:uncharacterized protein (TIGR02466 family)